LKNACKNSHCFQLLKKRFRKNGEELYTFNMMKVKSEPAPAASAGAAGPRLAPYGESFSLAHLSDLHLTTLVNARVTQLLNKRLLGYFSWRRKRRIVHSRDIVASLLEDLRLTRPDHVAVTGDLTHLGLPEEFAEVETWLPALGTPEQVTIVQATTKPTREGPGAVPVPSGLRTLPPTTRATPGGRISFQACEFAAGSP
jgi:hypothetical protein